MKVVLDTNVVVSRFLSPRGAPAQAFKLWEAHAFDLLVSCPILQEYKKALSYPKVRELHQLTGQEIDEIIDGFKGFSIFVEPRARLVVVKADPKDNMFLECAVSGKADCILSGDKHLLELKEYQGIQIFTPRAFLLALAKS